MTIRVYKFGLLPPVANARLVADQMVLAHRYRNALVEVERGRRAEVAKILAEHPDGSELQVLDDMLSAEREAARTAIKAARAAARGRVDDAAQRAHVRDLGSRLAELRARARASRRAFAADSVVRAKLDQVDADAGVRAKAAYAACGASWGTKQLVMLAMDAARKAPTPPDFVPRRPGGVVSVQIQGGVTFDELAADTQLQATAHARAGMSRPSTHDRNRILRVRVGSDDGRGPIWAEWPMKMHRPLPAGGRIKRATVSCRHHGSRVEWSVEVTVDEAACARPSPPAGGACALNLGFALRPGGIRVGYVVGDDGHEQEVLTPDAIRQSVDKADSIQAFRDRDLNLARASLCAWVAAQPEGGVPEWFALRTSHLALWRSPGAFAALRERWQRGWWDDGDAGYEILDRWFARDLHLERYETGMRRTALRRRTEHYRVVAAALAKRYRMLVVDDTDLGDLQRSPVTESEDVERAAVKRQQRLAAGSDLRAAMVNAFGGEGGGRVAELPSANVTVDHAGCGHRNARVIDSRELTCGGCGVVHDQDANACRNLLREWFGVALDWEAARAAKAAERKPSRSERFAAARARARSEATARND